MAGALSPPSSGDRLEPHRPSVWTGYAGLFLVVFAFFAVLVGRSDVDAERADAVVASLRTTFAAHPDDDAPFAAGAAVLAELAGTLPDTIRLARLERSRRGDELRIEIAAAELFADGEARLRDDRPAVLDRIVAALAAVPSGWRLELSGSVGTGPDPVTAAPAPVALAVDRAAALARGLVGRGAPRDALRVGVVGADPDRIRLVLRLQPLPATADPR